MVPKFRGDSDNWLDEESAASGSKRRKHSEKSPWIEPGLANASVVEVFPKQCRVRLDDPRREFLCSYRRATIFGGLDAKTGAEFSRERAPVAVGDRVRVESTGEQSGVVEGIATRKNSLSRPAPTGTKRDAKTQSHVIAANLDRVVVVAAAVQPEFSVGLVDRYLIAASVQGIASCLVVTKVDLLKGAEGELRSPTQYDEGTPWEVYSSVGIPVYKISSKTGEGLEDLGKILTSGTIVFCGHSGVGKTSLLNQLLGRTLGRVGDVSEATKKGIHTTTSAIMVPGKGEADWIDTPGVREFGLAGVLPEDLAKHFPEFSALQCETLECRHDGEPGCQAIGLPRHSSYLRILNSLKAEEN